VRGAGDHRIETVRGRIDDDLEPRILRFWLEHGALDPASGRRRLEEVVCVLLDPHGEIAGVNSVYEDRVPLIGGRRFWIYRKFLAPGTKRALAAPMVAAARKALDEEFTGSGEEPIGLCIVLRDPEEMRRHPEAVWPQAEMLFAGYTPAGHQVRIGYFEGATI